MTVSIRFDKNRFLNIFFGFACLLIYIYNLYEKNGVMKLLS